MQKISILHLPVGIFKIDSSIKMIYVNKRFCKITGYPKEKLLGERWLDVVHQEDLHEFIHILVDSMRVGIAYKFEFRFTHHDKNDIWVLCHVVPEKNSNSVVNYIGTINDITELKKTQADLQKLARFDPLTQLPNRYMFEDLLTKSLIRADRNKNILAIFYIDLDYFKNVNDFFGHTIGDQLLKEVGNRLKRSVRPEDFIIRLGGDEFAIILEDIHNISSISFSAQRIIDDFKQPFIIGEHEITATLSIGISVYPDENTTPETIVQHADQALYQSKKSGRNCYKYYNEMMQQQLERYMLIVKHLRNAIEKNQFELYYQPIIDMKLNSVASMEALLRWNNPLVRDAAPDEFISIAEETGLINQIGTWVINEALQQYKKWYENNDKMKNISIAVNISPSQLSESGIIETITEVLKETNIPTHNILFEITETAVMKRAMDTNSVLQVFLMELGIGISIDDFGTGYSSFTYLKQLPIKELKIDKSFIRDIGKNKNNESIIQAIINLAKTLDLEVVAEGVETKEQLDFLRENHCRFIQGYYFSKPLNRSEMTTYIESMCTY